MAKIYWDSSKLGVMFGNESCGQFEETVISMGQFIEGAKSSLGQSMPTL